MAIKIKYDKDKGLVQSEGSGFEVVGSTNIKGPLEVAGSLFVTGSGRVGINTSLPSVSLEIATSSIDDSPAIRFTGLRPRIQFYETDQTDQFQIQASNGQFKWQVQNNDFNDASVKWLMNPNGYMAIRDGKTSAAIPSRFYISGSDSEKLLIVSGANNPDVLAVLGSGRVGIGTASPRSTLEVAGSVFVSSSLDGGRLGVGIEPPSNFVMHMYNDTQPAFRLQRGADPSTGALMSNTYYEVNCGGNGPYFYSRNEDANGVFVWTGYDGTTFTEYGRFTGTGQLGIGVAAVDASAKLEIESTTEGFLPPRMTTTQRDAISTPAAGLMIYNTTTNKLNFYNSSAWEAVTSST